MSSRSILLSPSNDRQSDKRYIESARRWRRLTLMSAVIGLTFAAPLCAEPTGDDMPKDVLPQLIKYLRANLKDPDSIRDLRVCLPEKTDDGWRVSFSLNAKNSYGGYAGPSYYSAAFTNGVIDYAGSPDLGPELNGKLLSLTVNCRAVPRAEIERLLKAAE